MTAEEVKTLPMNQRIQIMEAIWEDLRDRFERSDLSPGVKDLLDQRRVRARDGSARILDWDQAFRVTFPLCKRVRQRQVRP